MPVPEVEWTGDYQELEKTEWYCPTSDTWSECNGPCLDGTPHTESRQITVIARVMRLKEARDI